MSNVKTLLVDSMNMMYRSYYAMPSLKNRDGQCIGAVLGFLNSLNRFANDFENVIVVWDPPISKTRRHELYPQYKMNRPPMDLDMKSQLPVMKEALDAFGYCQVVSSEDHEADDVIATLSRKVFSECNVCVLSRDKDLAQLIDREKRISLLDPVSGDILAYDDVETKFGVGPESLRDALALAGDSSDNIPGVPGIGMKTAAMLLTRFGGCVENIYSNIEDVPGKKRKVRSLPQMNLLLFFDIKEKSSKTGKFEKPSRQRRDSIRTRTSGR